MMRWIVGSSLRFRFLVVAVAAAMMFFGFGAAAEHAGRRLSRVRAAARRGPDALPRACRPPRSRSSSPCRWSRRWPASPGLDVAALQVGAPTCRSIELHLRAGHRPPATPASWWRSASATVTPTLPTWASPPFMIQPLSATSRVMKIGLSLGRRTSVIDLSMIVVLDDPGAAARACPASPTSRSGASGCRCYQVQVEPDAAGASTASRSTRSWRPRPMRSTRACCSYSDGAFIGTGGFVETPNQRLERPARACRSSRRRTWRRSPIEASGTASTVRLDDVADVVEDHQPLIGDAVINDGPGLHAHRREVPVGQHRSTSREGVEEAIDELQPGPAPASRSTPRSSGRRPSSSWRSTTSPRRCCSAACSSSLVLGAVPLRVAHAR